MLVVSFLALAAGWSRPRLRALRERRLFRLPVAVDVVLGALGVFAFAVTVYAGPGGHRHQSDNLAPTAVLRRLLGRRAVRVAAVRRRLPAAQPVAGGRPRRGWVAAARVGRRDARAAAVPGAARPLAGGRRASSASSICELCWAAAREPRPLAILMLVYFAVQFVGMSLYGVEPWTRRGDAFGVWFGAVRAPGAVRPPRRRHGSSLRPPVVGAAVAGRGRGHAALLLVGDRLDRRSTAPGRAPLFNDLAATCRTSSTSLGVVARLRRSSSRSDRPASRSRCAVAARSGRHRAGHAARPARLSHPSSRGGSRTR